MYANHINQLLYKDVHSKKTFIGVFSCDRIPKSRRRTYGFVVNTHTHEKKGEHWQLIFVQEGTCHFFCSLGLTPNSFVQQFLNKFSTTIINRTAPQLSFEYTCGGYCVFVLAMLSRGHKFSDVCLLFDVIKHDDLFIRHFMWEAFNYKMSPVR